MWEGRRIYSQSFEQRHITSPLCTLLCNCMCCAAKLCHSRRNLEKKEKEMKERKKWATVVVSSSRRPVGTIYNLYNSPSSDTNSGQAQIIRSVCNYPVTFRRRSGGSVAVSAVTALSFGLWSTKDVHGVLRSSLSFNAVTNDFYK